MMRKLLFLFLIIAAPLGAQTTYPPPVWQQMYTFTGADSFPAASPLIGTYSGCLVALVSNLCPTIGTNATQYAVPTPDFSQQPMLYNPLDKCVSAYLQDSLNSGGEWGNAWYCFFANQWRAAATAGSSTGWKIFWASLDRSLSGTGGVNGSGMVSIIHSTANQAVVTVISASARFAPIGSSFGILTSTDPALIGTWPIIGASGCSATYEVVCTSITLSIPGTSPGQGPGCTSSCTTTFTSGTTYLAGPSESPTRPYNRHTEGQWFDEQRGAYCMTTSIGNVASTPGTIWYAHTGIMDLYCAYRNNSPTSSCNANGIPGREGSQSCYYWKEICGFDTVYCATPNNTPVTTITGNGIPTLTSNSSGIGIKFPGTGRDPTNDVDVFFGGQWNSTIQQETLEFSPGPSTWANTNPSTKPTARWFQGDSKLVSLGKYSHKLFMAFGAINGTAGACTTNCLNETDIYDTTTHNWTVAIANNCSNAALPPCDLNAVYDWDPVLGVVVHVDNQNPAHVWYYDPVANTWTDEGNAGAPNLYPSGAAGCSSTPTYYNASGAYDVSINAFIVGIRYPGCSPGQAAMWKALMPIPIGVQAEEWPGGCTTCSSPQPVGTHRPLTAPIQSFSWPVPDGYNVPGPTGSPIPFNTNIPQFEIEDSSSNVLNAQFNCQTVWYPSGNCQWLTIDTQYNISLGFLEGSLGNLYLVQVPSGGGNLPSTPMGVIAGSVATITTGAATFTINLANNDFIHSAVVGSTTLVSGSRSYITADGIVWEGPAHCSSFTVDCVSCNPGPATTTAAAYTGASTCTTPYESVLDGTSTGFFRNNGGMLTDLVVTGNLVNSSGDQPVQYTLEYWFWNGHSDFQYKVTLQNAQKSTTGNDYASSGKMGNSAEIRLTPNLASGNMALTFGTGPTTVATTTLTGGSDTAVLGQGYTIQYEYPDYNNTKNCGPTGTSSTSTNAFDCVLSDIIRTGTPGVWTYTAPVGWTLTSSQAITGTASGTNAAGWAMQVDTSGNGVEFGLDEMAATYPASLESLAQGTEIRVGILPDQTVIGLVSPQAYLLGWQTYRSKLGWMNFFTTAPFSPSDIFIEWQQPLIARMPPFTYNTALPYPITDSVQTQLYDINLSPQPSYASGATSANAGTLLADTGCVTGCFGQNNNTLTNMYRFKFSYSAQGGPNQQDIMMAAYYHWLQNGWNGFHMVLAGSQPGKHRWAKNYADDVVNSQAIPHSDFAGNWRGITWTSALQVNWGYATRKTTLNLGQWDLYDEDNGGDHTHFEGVPDYYHITNDYQTQLTVEQQGFPDFFSIGQNPYNTPVLISPGHAVPAAVRSAAHDLGNAATDLYHLCGIHSPLVWGGSPAGCQTTALVSMEKIAAYNMMAPAFVSNFSLPPYNVTEASNAQTIAAPGQTYPSVFTTGQTVRGYYLTGLSINGGSDKCNTVTSTPCDGNDYHVAKPYQNQSAQFGMHLFDLTERQYRETPLWSAGTVTVLQDGMTSNVLVPVTGAAVQQSILGSGLWVYSEAFVFGSSPTTSGINYLTFTGYENRTPPCSVQNADDCSRTTSLGGFWGENYTHLGSICQETNSTVDLYGVSQQQKWDFYIERMGSGGYSELYSPEHLYTMDCILKHNLANPNSYTVAPDVPTLQDIPVSPNVVSSGTSTITYTLPVGAATINGTLIRLTYSPNPIQNWLPFYPNCDNTYTEGACPATSALTAPSISANTGSWLVGQTPATLTPWFASTPVNDPGLQTANGSYTFNCPIATCYLDAKVYAPAVNTIYVSQSGGLYSGVGTACPGQTAISVANHNTGSFWSASPTPGKISPGSTVKLCGTITSQLVPQGSGLSGQPILYVWDTGANLTAGSSAQWQYQSGAIYLNNENYLIFDGGVPCGGNQPNKALCNGIIQNGYNGTAGEACPSGTCIAQGFSSLIGMGTSGCVETGIEIRNLVLGPLYTRVANDVAYPGSDYEQFSAIYANCAGTNWNVHDNYFNLDAAGLYTINNNWSGLNIYNNEFNSVSHGWYAGIQGGGTFTTSTFHDNYVHDPVAWDTAADSYHHDGIHIAMQGGGGTNIFTNSLIYNNKFSGNWGSHFTSQIYGQGGTTEGGGGTISNVAFYNNVHIMTGATIPSNGLFNFAQGATGYYYFVNNTMVGSGATSSTHECFSYGGALGFTLQNNGLVNCGWFIYPQGGSGGGFGFPTITAWDHNIYEGIMRSGWLWGSTTSTSFLAWQNACQITFAGCDATGSSYLSSVDVSTTTGVPNVGSTFLGAGTNLTSLASTLPGITSSTSAGNTVTPVVRPTGSTPWDIGAFFSSSSSGSVTLTPSSYSYPSTIAPCTVGCPTATFTYQNTTSASITSIVPSLAVGTQYAITTNGCSSGTLGPGNVTPTSCTIVVSFEPTAIGLKTDTLSVASSTPTLTSNLSGTGVSASTFFGFPLGPLPLGIR